MGDFPSQGTYGQCERVSGFHTYSHLFPPFSMKKGNRSIFLVSGITRACSPRRRQLCVFVRGDRYIWRDVKVGGWVGVMLSVRFTRTYKW